MPADVPAQARSEPILSALESLLPTGLSTAPSGSLSLAEAQAQEAPAAEGPAGLSAGQAVRFCPQLAVRVLNPGKDRASHRLEAEALLCCISGCINGSAQVLKSASM